jgi:cytochrome c-type biogenesis protein
VDQAVTAFSLGLLSTLSPCVLPLYPGVLAYLSGQSGKGLGASRYLLGLFVLAGVMSAMLALGAAIAFLSISLSRALAILIPLAITAILLLGVLLLLGRNPFYRLPQLGVPGLRRPALNAFVYGAMYGPVAMPCNGPAVVAIFVYSFTLSAAVEQLWTFAWFGLGLGVPLLAISLLSGRLQRDLTLTFARHEKVVNRIGGLVLIGVAGYILLDNWDYLLLVYG